MKKCYKEELKAHEDEGRGRVKKEDFLRLYSAAHIRAFTPKVIKAAFAKTGVCPFNPDAIGLSAFKPSFGTTVSENAIPLQHLQSTPIRIVTRLLQISSNPSTTCSSPSTDYTGATISRDPTQISSATYSEPNSIEVLSKISKLKKSSVGFLFSDEPLTTETTLPSPTFELIPSLTDKLKALGLDDDEVSQSEADQYRIHELEQKIAHQDGVIASLKSHQVLQNVYTQKLQRQLHAKERSTEKGKS